MKQKEFANLLGISPSYLSRIKRGHVKSSKYQEKIEKLSEFEHSVIGIVADDLFAEVCKAAVDKAKSIKVRMFATKCFYLREGLIQRISELSELNDELKKEEEMRK